MAASPIFSATVSLTQHGPKRDTNTIVASVLVDV